MISVHIPYSTEGNIGNSYNNIIENSKTNWILLLDHDVFLALNAKWYEICMNTISKHNPALASCWTGSKGSVLDWIIYPNSPTTSNLEDHKKCAIDVFEKNKFQVTEVEKITGFFMLVNKQAWKEVGGFSNNGICGVDWDYCKKLRDKNFKILRMDGLYVYHQKARSWLNN